MQYGKLQRPHDDYDPETTELQEALYNGGECIREFFEDLLPRNDVEGEKTYEKRLAKAHYINYASPIINFFAASLFSKALEFMATTGGEPDSSSAAVPVALPAVYQKLKEDSDGQGTDLSALLKQCFIDAAITGKAWVHVSVPTDLPQTMSKAEFDTLSSSSTQIIRIDPKCVLNWKKSDSGKGYDWVLLYGKSCELLSIMDDEETETHTWTLYEADGTVTVWQIAVPDDTKLDKKLEIPMLSRTVYPAGMPLISLEFCHQGLHLMSVMQDTLIELFRKRNALSWSLDRSAYPTLVAKLEDSERLPVMGAGYYVIIGKDEELSWLEPQSTAVASLSSYVDSTRQELYRTITQMAQGIDNNAAAVGRSGASKLADAASTEIILEAYGEKLEEFAEKILQYIALSRNETQLTFHVSGMEDYTGYTLTDLVNPAYDSIQSPTFQAERAKKIVRSIGSMSEQVLAQIDSELDAPSSATVPSVAGQDVPVP